MALAQQPQGSASTPAAAAAAGAAAAHDPASYDKLREAFIRDLRHFHDTRGTSFKHKPKINGKEVDLFKLYTVVTSRGGWVQVNNKNEWSWICEEFHLPSGCVNSSVGLKQIYLRYLDRYEKVHFLGEDGNQGDGDDEDSRHRKWNVKSLHCVPLTYNHHQHNVAETLREYNGLSSNLYKPSNYDKLALSLLSPLPNEQDFAINVCTFLSNEGKHTLRLDKYPRLINHLLAHAGVFDAPGTRQLFIESYSRVRNYSINSFWQDVLDAPDLLDLTDERAFIVAAQKAAAAAACKGGKRKNSPQQVQGLDGAAGTSKAKAAEQTGDEAGLECPMDVDEATPSNYDRLDNGVEVLEERLAPPDLFIDEASCSSSVSSGFKDQNQNSIKFEEDDKDLFCVGRTLGTQDPYGQRVLQIASILRNLSFTPENAAILGRSPNFLRFVLLCTRARWSNLHQLGFDTLGNIANEIVLKEIGQRLTKVVLECVSKGISSQDRFVVISCLEVLNKISQQDLNEETLTLGLYDSVYELICRFLALSDIALLVHTLECLYALTSLGERPCNSVARVRGAIDTLVALVTVEAQSYGPKACILMRVVETVSSVPATQQQQSHHQTSDVQHQSQSQLPAQSSPQQHHHHTNQHHSQHHQTTSEGPSSAGFANWLKMKNSSLHQSSAPSTGAPTATNVQIPGTTTSRSSSPHASPSPSIHKQQVQNQVQTQMQSHQAQTHQAQMHQTQSQLAQPQPTSQTQTQTQPPPQQAQVLQSPAVPKVVAANSAAGQSRPGTPKSNSKAANSLQQQHAHQQIIQENEQFALSWLKSNFELCPGLKIEQEELYKKYLSSCTKIGRRGVIAPLHFPRCVRSVFGGTIGPNSLKGDPGGTLYYEGIRVRATPVQVMASAQNVVSSTSANPQASSGDGSTSGSSSGSMVQQAHQRSIDSLAQSPTPSSPILKAQLSAPPRQSVLSSINTLKTPSLVTGETKSQVSVAHPHLSQALLSSGAQQQQQQQQGPGSPGQPQMQTVQVIVKDDGKGGTTSSSIIKSLLATKVTVGGECMQAAAAPTASVSAITNAQVATSVSANQLVTASQVAQRQQQQQQQRQQQIQSQLITSGIQPGTVSTKTFVNAKTKQIITVKKVQRLNGAKIVVPNNCEKSEPMDTDSSSQPPQLPSFVIGDVNHRQQQVILGSPSPTNALAKPQRNASTPTVEDSDSTNNSLASSSGIGGSRDCSGMGAEEDNSLTSFEGLLNGAPSNTDIEAQEDGSSKDSSSAGLKDKVPMQSIMLADLLEKKTDKEPMVNGVLGKKDLVENHIKKALKEEPPDDTKVKVEPVSGDAVQVPVHVAGIKRSASTSDEAVEAKKPKYANGTSSPGPATPSQQVKPEEVEDEKEEKVTVSSTAANLYAALAADIIGEADLEETLTSEDVKPTIKEEVVVKEETVTPAVASQESQPVQQQVQVQQPQQQIAMTQQQLQQQIQQGLLVAGGRQIVVAQQAIQSNNQIMLHPGQVKNAAATTRPVGQTQQVLQVQQNSSGQTHYVISGGIPGQNYVLAQPQTALVQGQAQTVLVAQQQGTNAKTIIILQPQAAAQQQTQKVLAMTPQGQQVVVTQVQRQLLQGSAVAGSAPPPLVSSTANNPQTAVVANNTPALSNPIQVVQTQQQASAVPSRVSTPTPTTTPPPSRPMTPQQQPMVGNASKPTPNPVLVKDTKDFKVVVASNEAEKDGAGNSGRAGGIKKPSTTQHDAQSTNATSSSASSRSQTPTIGGTPASTAVGNVPKTITIKYDPNSFLCEWRGCLRQFKTPRKVFLHACEAHCPTGSEEVICLWASCDTLKRRRFSLMAHLSDKHCCDEEMFKRRKHLATSGKTEIATTTTPTPTAHHPGYAPNAAFHAIKRHALEFVNPKELMQRPSKPAAAIIASSSSQRPGQNPPPEQDDNEGPVTKSIRLTAALILRNLVIYSAHGRRHLRAYEPHLAGVALSNVESSRTIAQVLYDMNDQSSSGHR